MAVRIARAKEQVDFGSLKLLAPLMALFFSVIFIEKITRRLFPAFCRLG